MQSQSYSSSSNARETARARLRNGLNALFACLLCALAWTYSAAPLRAQSPGAQTEYQSLVQKGLQEYQLGNFNEAKAFFTRAHALSPSARTLRGLGMSAYELRNYVESIDYFQRALAASERPLTPQMRTEIEQLLQQAGTFVTRIKLSLEPANAVVRLDAREVVRDSDGSLLVDPGAHELLLEAPNHEAQTRSIRTDGGETLALAVELRSNLTPQPGAQDAPSVQLNPGVQLSAASPRDPGQGPSAAAQQPSSAPIIVIAASGAVAVAGGVLLGVALNNKHAAENPESSAEGAPPRYADYRGRADSVLPLSAAGISALTLGTAGAVAGLIWQFTRARADERPRARLGFTPMGVVLDGRF